MEEDRTFPIPIAFLRAFARFFKSFQYLLSETLAGRDFFLESGLQNHNPGLYSMYAEEHPASGWPDTARRSFRESSPFPSFISTFCHYKECKNETDT